MRIFHPTDLDTGSATAFLHALRLAVDTRSHLTILHVAGGGDVEWSDLPGVRSTLAKWGLVKNADDMDGLFELGLSVRKVISEGGNPVRACLDHLEDHPTDLVVLSTHQREGRSAWLKKRVAEPIARRSGEPSLFVPHDRPGFLDAVTGKVTIRRVLVPVAIDPHPRRALEVTAKLLEATGQGNGVITLLHVGSADSDPMIEQGPPAGWTMERIVRQGDTVDTIAHVAEAIGCDLVVMTTKGHEGFLDALRGSTTEQVLRAVRCPVLAVPV
jgi:nucleotide-binding universal stress UspA family protein